MLASRTSQRPNTFALPAVLIVAVLVLAALAAYNPFDGPSAVPAQPAIANPYPSYRLNELEAYRQSEWGLALSALAVPAPWTDWSRLPAGYVLSEKSGPAQPQGPRDLYTDLMAVK